MQTLITFISFTVLYPAVEEIVFRWALLDTLDSRLTNVPAFLTNLIAAVAFGAAHWVQWDAVHAVLVIIPSLLLGVVWQRTHSLTLCTLVHGGMNAFYLLVVVPFINA